MDNILEDLQVSNDQLVELITMRCKEAAEQARAAYDSRLAPPAFNLDFLYDIMLPSKTSPVENMLSTGTYLYAGSPELENSFFLMQLAYHVAAGIPLWGHSVHQGKVLYLTQRKELPMIKKRMHQMRGFKPIKAMKVGFDAAQNEDQLANQIDRFLLRLPDTRLVIIDSLQRTEGKDADFSCYQADPQLIAKLNVLAGRHDVCFLIVCPAKRRKAGEFSRMFPDISDLFSIVDGVLALQGDQQNPSDANLYVIERDQEDQKLSLTFDREQCWWNLVQPAGMEIQPSSDSMFVQSDEFIQDMGELIGSVSDPMGFFHWLDVSRQDLTKEISESMSALSTEHFISNLQQIRSREKHLCKQLIEVVDSLCGEDQNADCKEEV